MTEMRDPFGMLQRANPVRDDQLPEVSSSILEETFEQVLAKVRPMRPRRGMPPRRRAVVVLVVAAVAGVAWTIYLTATRPTKPLPIGCYEAADLTSRTEVVANDGRPPTEICVELWRRAVFGPGPIPPLVACVLPSGVVGVFPETGNQTCRQVGATPLQSPSPALTDELEETIALRDALRAALLEACLDERQALDLVRSELVARALSDWTVDTVRPFSSQRPCASVGIDAADRTVLLIPVERR